MTNLALNQKVALTYNFLDVSGNPVAADASITWVSGTPGVATVQASGAQSANGYTGGTCEVTPVSLGTSVITATGTTPEGVALSSTFSVTVVANAGPTNAAVTSGISAESPVRS